jgi:soluble lytic murein transglycosylase-like protein
MDPILLAAGAAALLFGGKKAAKGAKPAALEDAATDGAVLESRANQPNARKWSAIFRSQDAPPMLADALARWAGIESGGNPLAQSSLGERGLLQCSEATALQGGVYTHQEWESLKDPRTSAEEHARLGLKLFRASWSRAKKYVENAPSGAVDQVFYAKLYHQYPADVKRAALHGPALLMARALKEQWKGRPKSLHRLRAANVVAFGTFNP